MNDGRVKKRSIVTLVIIAAVMATVLVSCGDSSADNGAVYSKSAAPVMEESMAAGAYDYDEGFAGEAVEESADRSSGEAGTPEVGKAGENAKRKLITTVNISAETENLDPLVTNIENKAVSLGGYIESSSIYGNDSFDNSGYSSRQANITARIPADRLGEFIALLEGGSNIVSRSRNVEDVTLNYVDTQAHKEALKAEMDSLLKLMENAESVEDIMAIEMRLTDVRYELESIESRLRTMDNQVDYSTVYINISEVRTFTPQKTATVSERIVTGFNESFNSVAEGCVNFGVFFVTHIPQFIVFIVVVVIIVLIIRLIVLIIVKSCEASKKRRQKRLERKMARAAAKGKKGAAVPDPVQTNTIPAPVQAIDSVQINNTPSSALVQTNNAQASIPDPTSVPAKPEAAESIENSTNDKIEPEQGAQEKK